MINKRLQNILFSLLITSTLSISGVCTTTVQAQTGSNNNYIKTGVSESFKLSPIMANVRKNLSIKGYIDTFIDKIPLEGEYASPTKEKSMNLQMFIDSFNKDSELTNIQKGYIQDYIDFFIKHYSKDELNPQLFQNYFNLYKHNLTLSDWGFNGEVEDWASSDRDYEWYIDQGDTGAFSRDNCGPSVATMAIKWANQHFNKTGEDARNTYMPYGGWWYTTTIVDYLKDYNISTYYTSYDFDRDQIKELINKDRIAILCIDTYNLGSNYDNSRIGRFYSPSSGHFIIVKGYLETSTGFYLETYDPNSLGQRYQDGTFMGQNRYYEFSDINNAIRSKWRYMIVVEKEN